MSTKSREVLFGSRIRGAKIHAEGARERAKQTVREADGAAVRKLIKQSRPAPTKYRVMAGLLRLLPKAPARTVSRSAALPSMKSSRSFDQYLNYLVSAGAEMLRLRWSEQAASEVWPAKRSHSETERYRFINLSSLHKPAVTPYTCDNTKPRSGPVR